MTQTTSVFVLFLSLSIVPAFLPYAIATSMWSWRSLLICGVLLGLPIAAVWVEEWQAFRSPDYNAGAVFGLTLFVSVSIAAVWGLVIRAYTLTKPRARPFKFHAGGFLVLAAGAMMFFFGSTLLHR